MANPITARGVIAYKPGEPGVVEDFLVPHPGPGEALVRILASGVCHTDLSAKNGVFGTDYFPFLLGHEGSGIVEEVGEGVTNVAKGDFVILAWRAPCGECRFCLVGKPHLCAASLNATQKMTTMDGTVLTPILGIGTFCTHTLVHARQCIKVNKDLPPEQMSLIGCGVMTGVGAALYTANVQPGNPSRWSAAVASATRSSWAQARRRDDDHRGRRRSAETRMGQGLRRHAHGQPERWRSGRGDQGDHRRVWRQCIIRGRGQAGNADDRTLVRDLAGTCVIIGVAGQEAMVELPIRQILRSRRSAQGLLVRRLPADARLPAARRLVCPGPT